MTKCAYAQFGYGLETGIGMSSMKFAPPLGYGYTTGTTSPILSAKAGGIIDLGLNKNIYFQSGISFLIKGATRKFGYNYNDTLIDNNTQTLTLGYVEVPVRVVYKTSIQGRNRFFAGLGVSFSYLVSEKSAFSEYFKSTDTIYNTNRDVTTNLGAFDVGMNFVAGIELSTGLFFGAYYTMGVTDIGTGTEIDKNRVWGINTGYIFGKWRNINKEEDELIDKSK